MKILIAFFKLIRGGNLLIMLLTMLFTYYCLSGTNPLPGIFTVQFLLLEFSILLTAAGGYIINDYYDVKLDLINKPEKVIVGNEIPRRWAMMIHTVINFFAILFGITISLKVGIAIMVCSALLYLYSVSLKKRFLSGNILVAVLCAFLIFILRLYNKSLPLPLIIAYSVFAFIITLIREIIKDTEDMEGDRSFQCKTLPIVLGIKKTKQVLLFLIVLFLILLLSWCFYSFISIPFQFSKTKFIYVGYLLSGVAVPMLAMASMIINAKEKKDFSRISSFAKFIMLAGILSMVILKF
ncbi:MAG: geranylgeranylglycerol-phosphate geranylgeranyltransferase [Bacteroidia bacterium]